MKIGIIREGKTPSDSRVPLIPAQCAELIAQGHDIVVQPSNVRTFTDEEYRQAGVPLREDLTDRDLLLGVKEVPIEQLIPDKDYCFFAHVIKEQPYNQPLLRAVMDRRIRLMDYEAFTGERGKRLIAFGYFAGMVGAHNGLWAYAQRHADLTLPRLKDLRDYAEAREIYAETHFPKLRIVLTGTGRVGQGAAKVLDDMGIRRVEPADYLKKNYEEAVYTVLMCRHYVKKSDGGPFDKEEFYAYPERYETAFLPYAHRSDIFINGIYWDNRAPAFFAVEDMRSPDFRARVIADVTCDIAPVASVPSTLRPSTIADPVYGYDPVSASEVELSGNGSDGTYAIMAVDNLPNELPRDASTAFGQMFMDKILPEFNKKDSAILRRASVTTRAGELGPKFQYLTDYAAGVGVGS